MLSGSRCACSAENEMGRVDETPTGLPAAAPSLHIVPLYSQTRTPSSNWPQVREQSHKAWCRPSWARRRVVLSPGTKAQGGTSLTGH